MKVVESRAYGIDKGLPSVNDVSISEIDDNIHFATPEGAFIYDAAGDTIVRDTPLEKRIGVQSLLKVWRDKDFIYALTPREIIRCRVSLAEDIRRLPVIPEHARPLNLCVAMFAVDDTTMIYPNYSGYTVFNFGKRNEADTDVTAGAICHIRMKNAEDSVIVSDSFSSDRKALHISHSNNSVVIEFSAPDRYLSMIKGYSYRLNDEPWSTPSMNTVKEYTDLDGGDYVFEIKTLLIDGREHVSSVSFEVEHPWYRRLWFIALTIIICIATAMSAFFVLRHRINSRQQKLIKAKDAFIARQKAEFESIDEMKDRKIDELEKENLHNELEHKSQEIINLLLSLSNKNEALISIKEELEEYQRRPQRRCRHPQIAHDTTEQHRGKSSVGQRARTHRKRIQHRPQQFHQEHTLALSGSDDKRTSALRLYKDESRHQRNRSADEHVGARRRDDTLPHAKKTQPRTRRIPDRLPQ